MGDGRSGLQHSVGNEIGKTPALRITDGVYEPMEDSYLLASATERMAFGKVLDMGTGSGIQGITAAMQGCDVTFADIEENALKCARQNVNLNGVKGNFVATDLFENINGKFNTLIFNPPYVASDPLQKLTKINRALDGGAGGREVIDRFLAVYKRYLLRDHTVLMIESSQNGYQKDIERLKAKIVGKTHIFFEDIVVLEFK